MAAWRDGDGLRRGQVRASLSFLAWRWRWSRTRVGRFLAYLEDREMVVYRPGKGRDPGTITIVNYQKWSIGSGADMESGPGMSYNERDTRADTRTEGVDFVAQEFEAAPDPDGGDRDDQHALGIQVPGDPAAARARAEAEARRAVVARYVENHRRFGVEPTRKEIGRAAGTARRVVRDYPLEDVRDALEGMDLLYEHDPVRCSDATPWEPADLYRKFRKAALQGRRGRPLPKAMEKIRKNVEAIDAAADGLRSRLEVIG